MKDLEPHKRLTLAVALLLLMQSAGALDDLAEMFIKRMLAIHQKGKDALELLRIERLIWLSWEGILAISQIAKKLNKSEGAVRQLLSRTLNALRRLYEKPGEGDSKDE